MKEIKYYTFLFFFLVTAVKVFGADLTQSVQTELGPVVGQNVDGIQIFKGIPYAAPPVGELRWRSPQPAIPWQQPRKVLNDGAICVQPKELGQSQSVGSEDCLTLNIWAPSGGQTPRAVMVFIHGGFYVTGSSDQKFLGFVKLYDGLNLAKRGDVVVVSFNYRLGPMGFFAHPALFDGSPESQSGNFGLMDQIAALKWVKSNISSFGGDPLHVTVFGESAGASSIIAMIASPKAKDLFSQAIIESGYQKDISRKRAFTLSSNLSAKVGCLTAECLRNISAEKIIAGSVGSAKESAGALFVPNQDGWIIPEPLEKAYSLGHVNKVSAIMGTNSDETGNLANSLYGPTIKTDDELKKTIAEAYGNDFWDRANKTYGKDTLGSPQNRLIRFSTDAIFTCPISEMTRQLSNNVGVKVWRYVFSQKRATHGAELPFVFGTLPWIVNWKNQRALSQIIDEYWTTFAKTGDPNGKNQIIWPEFKKTESYINFNEGKDGIAVGQEFRVQECSGLEI